jgi:hypothetical protein
VQRDLFEFWRALKLCPSQAIHQAQFHSSGNFAKAVNVMLD